MRECNGQVQACSRLPALSLLLSPTHFLSVEAFFFFHGTHLMASVYLDTACRYSPWLTSALPSSFATSAFDGMLLTYQPQKEL